MATFDRDEVEAAFRNYWQLGAVGEDWDAWCDQCFTEDVTYIEHVLGDRTAARPCARGSSRRWRSTARSTPRTSGTWSTTTAASSSTCRTAATTPNRAQPPIDFPGITVLQYAGDGKFSLEEDFWSLPEGIETAKRYSAACKQFDPDSRAKRTRRNWGNGPDWTQGASTYAESRARARRLTTPCPSSADAGAGRAHRGVARRRDVRGLRAARVHRPEDRTTRRPKRWSAARCSASAGRPST